MAVRKVAIVGLSPETHDDAPWDDVSWEKWGLAWDAERWAYCDRLFEIHAPELIGNNPSHLERLAEADNLITQDSYPLHDAIEALGDYFACSISYMLAMAILEEVDEIGIWGVSGTENYLHQRPNIEYLIGFARGRGITVTAHEAPLLTHTSRYGYV